MAQAEERGFVERQVAAVRAGGWRVAAEKAGRRGGEVLVRVLLFLPALVVVAVVRLLRPFVLLRTGWLNASRIGHFVGNTEVYLSRRDTGEESGVDLLGVWGPISNRQIAVMWRRLLPHVTALYREAHRINRSLPGAAPHLATLDIVDWDGALAKSQPHLAFTAEEVARGEARRAELAPGAGALGHVCLHSRDTAYLRLTAPFTDATRHDYRDSSIANFAPAASELASRGYAVFRMGAAVESPWPLPADGRLVDYANTARDDFMDVYLEATCAFHLGDGTGLNEIPRAFRRPVAYTNCIPLEPSEFHSKVPGGILIPKLLRSSDNNRFLTFAEVAALDVARDELYESATYARLGLTPVENSAEEISALAAEIAERIAGSWLDAAEDAELQDRFWEVFGRHAHEVLGVRVGAAFLRAHRDLLA